MPLFTNPDKYDCTPEEWAEIKDKYFAEPATTLERDRAAYLSLMEGTSVEDLEREEELFLHRQIRYTYAHTIYCILNVYLYSEYLLHVCVPYSLFSLSSTISNIYCIILDICYTLGLRTR